MNFAAVRAAILGILEFFSQNVMRAIVMTPMGLIKSEWLVLLGNLIRSPD